jgi:hypothetical protein
MSKKSLKWLLIASTILLPSLFLLDNKLVSTPSYCASRSRVLSNLSASFPLNIISSKNYSAEVNSSFFDEFAMNAFRCMEVSKSAPVANKDVLENYVYPLNLTHPWRVSFVKEGKEVDPEKPWRLDVENSFYLSELFGECSQSKKCVAAKFHIRRGTNEGYFHYTILAKDSNGKFTKIKESFGQSPYKG